MDKKSKFGLDRLEHEQGFPSETHNPYAHDEEEIEMNDFSLSNAEQDEEEGGGELSSKTQNTKDDPFSASQEWVLREERPRSFFNKFWQGPLVPKDQTPTIPQQWTILNFLNDFPEKRFKKRFSLKSRTSLLILYCIAWFLLVWSFVYPYLFHVPIFTSKDGTKTNEIISLSCNSYLEWAGKNNECGLNAAKCKPFDNHDYYIRCPALCDRGGWVYSPLVVGDQKIRYKSYVIGGGLIDAKEDQYSERLTHPYRADAFPCAAGVHAGLVSPVHGACLKLSMSGAQLEFKSTKGKTGDSIYFDTFFPSSFVIREMYESISSGCYDPRVLVVALNIILGLPVFYLADSIVGYWITTMVGYWSIVLVFDPPVVSDPRQLDTVYDLFSVGIQRLLPLGFVLYVLWNCSIKRCLENGSPVLKVVFWYPLFWLGTLNNVTFDRLPVDRLTPEDLKGQPGAIASVLFIFTIIVVSACFQGYSLWKSGRFQKYFKIYITFIITLVVFAYLPGLSLRIHHYILGILLTPGCATRGLSAYVLQGILIGLLLSGVGRWDFASILETRGALLRGAAGDAKKPPTFSFDPSAKGMISWNDVDVGTSSGSDYEVFTGYSLIANDVEVYAGQNKTISIESLMQSNVFFKQLVDSALEYKDEVKLYLRVAYANEYDSSSRGDYTNAATYFYPSGKWTDPVEGVS